jgi:glyoxylase-like metal-dependent hydrolase (beta-lactamase superfamily II)
VIRAGAVNLWGDLEWEAIAAPGHDMGALMYWNPEHRILISGDALWQHGFGIVFPPEMNPAALPAARATLDRIAALGAEVVIPGHGEPFSDVDAALQRSYARLAAFEADSTRIARHIVKVMLTFSLLASRQLALADLPPYCQRVPVLRELNDRYLRLEPAALADWLVQELTRAGVARADGGFLRAA